MPRQRVIKCREQGDALLPQGRKVTADAAKHRYPVFGAEAPGDLLLHFDHAQISLRLIVVKRDRKIVEEAQDHPLSSREAIQQLACRALFGSPWFSLPLFRLLGWRRVMIDTIAFCPE